MAPLPPTPQHSIEQKRKEKLPALWGLPSPAAWVDMALKRRDTLPRLRPGPSLAGGMGEGLGLREYTQGGGWGVVSEGLKVGYLP